MKVRIITDGTIEGTKIIDMDGNPIEDLEVVDVTKNNYDYSEDLTNVFHSIRKCTHIKIYSPKDSGGGAHWYCSNCGLTGYEMIDFYSLKCCRNSEKVE